MVNLTKLVLGIALPILTLTSCIPKVEQSKTYQKAVEFVNNPTGRAVQSLVPITLEDYFLNKTEKNFMPLADYNHIGAGFTVWEDRFKDTENFTKTNPLIIQRDGVEIGRATYLSGSGIVSLTVIRSQTEEDMWGLVNDVNWLTVPPYKHIFVKSKDKTAIRFKLWDKVNPLTDVMPLVNALLSYEKRLGVELMDSQYLEEFSPDSYLGLLEILKENYDLLLKEGFSPSDRRLEINHHGVKGLGDSVDYFHRLFNN